MRRIPIDHPRLDPNDKSPVICCLMSLTLANLSVQQLKRALVLREQIDALEAELNDVVGGEIPKTSGTKTLPSDKPAKKGRRKMSAAAKAKMSAAAKKRWKVAKAAGKKTL